MFRILFLLSPTFFRLILSQNVCQTNSTFHLILDEDIKAFKRRNFHVFYEKGLRIAAEQIQCRIGQNVRRTTLSPIPYNFLKNSCQGAGYNEKIEKPITMKSYMVTVTFSKKFFRNYNCSAFNQFNLMLSSNQRWAVHILSINTNILLPLGKATRNGIKKIIFQHLKPSCYENGGPNYTAHHLLLIYQTPFHSRSMVVNSELGGDKEKHFLKASFAIAAYFVFGVQIILWIFEFLGSLSLDSLDLALNALFFASSLSASDVEFKGLSMIQTTKQVFIYTALIMFNVALILGILAMAILVALYFMHKNAAKSRKEKSKAKNLKAVANNINDNTPVPFIE